MRQAPLFLAFLLWGMIGCTDQSDILESARDGYGLYLSTDTVSFDTLVAGRQSITRRLRILNQSGENLTLPAIRLQRGDDSPFLLTINGQAGTSQPDIPINHGDSLLVLIELTPDNNGSNSIEEVVDYVVFDNPSTGQNYSVTLQAWAVQVTLRQKAVICSETWTRQTAQLITDTLVVDAGCTLTVEEGTQVLFDPGGVIFVLGQLQVQGTPEEPVLFRSSRMDAYYQQAPGLWNGVYFLEGSTDNNLRHLILENSQTGLRIGTPDSDTLPDVILRNVTIRHSSQFGIQAYNSDLFAENLLVYDIGIIPCFHAIGGSYRYQHATITNFPSQLSNGDPAVVFADHLILDDQTLSDVLTVDLRHSIVWGGGSATDVVVSLVETGTDRIRIENNIIYSEQDWDDNLVSSAIDFVRFRNPFSFDYQLDSLSPAIDASFGSTLSSDIDGRPRDSVPDLGAYEYQDHE